MPQCEVSFEKADLTYLGVYRTFTTQYFYSAKIISHKTPHRAAECLHGAGLSSLLSPLGGKAMAIVMFYQHTEHLSKVLNGGSTPSQVARTALKQEPPTCYRPCLKTLTAIAYPLAFFPPHTQDHLNTGRSFAIPASHLHPLPTPSRYRRAKLRGAPSSKRATDGSPQPNKGVHR